MMFLCQRYVPSVIALLVTLATLSIAEAADRPPNIVLIVSDDQGYNDLGVTNDEILTPNLDRLARQGVRLTSFYVAWPACTPSRGALLSGRYPQRNGIYDMIRNEAPDYGHKYTAEEYSVTWERIGGMDTREVLLPQLLKQAGYYSGIFGKWDLGMHKRFLPLQRGFDEFYGFVNTGIDFYTHERYGVPSMYRNNEPTMEDQGTYATTLFEREALRFIDEHKEQPFFLYVPFNAPHGASNLDPKIRGLAQAPRKWRKMYPEYHEQESYIDAPAYGQPAKRPNRAMRKAHYLGCVTAMDDSIGAILDRIDRYELTENTLVIFFSDNGGSGIADNTPLRGRKSTMWEGGNRVCFLARFPGRIPAGTVNDEFLTSLELLPTLLNLAGAPLPDDIHLDGFDMMPVLAGREPSPRREMFWERAREGRAARLGHWKWVDSHRGQGLFNLSEDIGERRDLSKRYPEKLAELKAAFANWKQQMKAAEPRRPFRDF